MTSRVRDTVKNEIPTLHDYSDFTSGNSFNLFSNQNGKPGENSLVGTSTDFDFLNGVFGINSISDLLKVGGDSRIPKLEPPAYSPYDITSGQIKPKDNSFWEAHPGFYEIALKKMA